MTVHKLKSKQRGPECSYCPQQANWRGLAFGKFSCNNHKPKLEVWDFEESKPEYSFGAMQLEWITR